MFPSFSFCDHNVETLVRVVRFIQVVPGFLERTFGIVVEVPSSLEIGPGFLSLKFLEKSWKWFD